MTAQSKETTQQNSIGKALVRIFAGALMVLVASYPMVTEATSDQVRRPLDLPSGGGRDEEDQPLPDIIQFFGHDFEGDAFVWVLDISGSMTVSGRIDELRGEFTGAILNLSSQSDFGAVAFNQNIQPLDILCTAAYPDRKSRAIAWISGLQPYGTSCLAVAVIQGLEIIRKSSNTNRRLIVVGDGLPACPSLTDTALVLNEIAAANWDRIPIDAVFVGEGSALGIEFFQQLANSFGGSMVIAQ
jgi:Mg-chelatase subunit ChlD